MWYTNVVRRTLVEMIPTPSFFLNIPKMDKIVCHIGVGSGTEKRSHVLRPMVLLYCQVKKRFHVYQKKLLLDSI